MKKGIARFITAKKSLNVGKPKTFGKRWIMRERERESVIFI